MFIPLLLAAATISPMAAVHPTDTPIEPITADIITLGIEAGIMDETCDLYSQLIPIFADALGGDVGLAMDVTDAYVVASFEASWEPAGSAFTLEAADAYTDYLHSCV